MQVILLEHNHNLGSVGDLVKVKDGYARNYLLPQKKAIRATEESILQFEAKRAQIEMENAEKKKDAEKSSGKVEGKFFVLIRQAGEDGRLYGSVSARDVANAVSEGTSTEVSRSQVVQFAPIKNLGVHVVKIALHPEVIVNVHVNVARSSDEAETAKKEFLNPKKSEADAESEATAEENQEGKQDKKKKKSAKVVDADLDEAPAA